MAERAVQRRLAAIVSADVAGYSRLMGEDEAGTLATICARRRSSSKHGGGTTTRSGPIVHWATGRRR